MIHQRFRSEGELLPLQMNLELSLRILWARLLVLLFAVAGGTLVLLIIEGAISAHMVNILCAFPTLAVLLYLSVLSIRHSNSLQMGTLDEALVNRGLECSRLGEHKQAKSLYIRALTHSPVNKLALNNMAYELLNEDGNARIAFVFSSLSLFFSGRAKAGAEVLDTHAWAYFKTGRDLKKAESYLRSALPEIVATRNADKIIETLYHLIAVLNARDNVLDAIGCYQVLVTLHPNAAYARQALHEARKIAASWTEPGANSKKPCEDTGSV